MKNRFKNFTPRQWLIFLLVIAILIYFFVVSPNEKGTKIPDVSNPLPNPGSNDGRTTGGGGGGDYLYSTNILEKSISLSNNLSIYEAEPGLYTDETKPGEYFNGSFRMLDANGRTYKVYYYISNVPLSNGNDEPLNFDSIALPPGQVLSIRKIYIDSSWQSTFEGVRNNIFYSRTSQGGNDAYCLGASTINVTT